MYNLDVIQKIHFIGIGGISMSALAKLMIAYGKTVTGSDLKYNNEICVLNQLGAKTIIGHDLSLLGDIDLVVYTSSLDSENPELTYATEKGILAVKRSKFLAMVASDFESVIAIAGTHGKTTVTAMLTSIFLESNEIFTAHIGGNINNSIGNLIYKGHKYFITEACEYMHGFIELKPDIAVVLAVEYDHPDTYESIRDVYAAFDKFIDKIKTGGMLAIGGSSQYYTSKTGIDDKYKLSERLLVRTYGFEDEDSVAIRNATINNDGCYTIRLSDGESQITVKLTVPGYHNILNAAAAYTVSKYCNISDESIKRGLEGFVGIERRFQAVGSVNGAQIVVDYAHHPTEIVAAIATANSMLCNRVVCVFQPHTYSRTKSLYDDFIRAFVDADLVIIFKEYPAREIEIEGFSAYRLYQGIKMRGMRTYYYSALLGLSSFLMDELQENDMLLILGAGDIDILAKLLA
ncbi:MAG: UDP-N-acetylmuramate--L-alanine ligase [Christensenellaceae bacterium]|jgi:UDP-N-acetylmuramate--alanine ligase|nr:UDP-N-acetylmuramate--L-alanine ligase [Christensenellaceae bacterium]